MSDLKHDQTIESDLKHDQTRWRFTRETSYNGHYEEWHLQSDEACAMARMQLPHFSQNYKKENPKWEEKFNADAERIQANANIMQASPIMLKALLAAKKGDTSLIDYAIAHAMGEKKWTD
jgi:hypothetical protein